MNKSILIIDTPKCCEDCPLINSHYDNEYGLQTYCGSDYHRIKEKNKKDFCPLKPLPQKIEGYIDYEYGDGWNDCIDKILESNK